MSQSPESRLWGELRPRFQRVGKFVRIESGSTRRGIPDVWGLVGNTPAWIELKSIQRGLVVPLRKEQIAWMTSIGPQHRCFVLARRLDAIKVWPACFARDLVKPGGWNVEGGAFYAKPWDYAAMLHYMFVEPYRVQI